MRVGGGEKMKLKDNGTGGREEKEEGGWTGMEEVQREETGG